METKFIEVRNEIAPGTFGNWGKFCLARFDAEEWAREVRADDERRRSLIASQGWTPEHLWVLDLATGEGAYFKPGGNAHADLDKHKVWVCPLFQPFLEWLYTQDLSGLSALPDVVDLPEAPFAMAGYRRPGPERG